MNKNLKKCCEIDETTKKLWSWAEKTQKIGTYILIVLIIYGIINTILTGVTTYAEIDSYASDEEAAIGTLSIVLTNITTCLISGLITYCAYNIVSLILKAIGNITQNTKISANISFYNIQETEGITDNSDETVAKNEETQKTMKTPEVLNAEKIINKTKDDNFIYVQCKNCKKEFSFQKGMKKVRCPWCNVKQD